MVIIISESVGEIFNVPTYIFISSEDVVVPNVAIMSKGDRCIGYCSPIGFLSTMARSILRPQEI